MWSKEDDACLTVCYRIEYNKVEINKEGCLTRPEDFSKNMYHCMHMRSIKFHQQQSFLPMHRDWNALPLVIISVPLLNAWKPWWLQQKLPVMFLSSFPPYKHIQNHSSLAWLWPLFGRDRSRTNSNATQQTQKGHSSPNWGSFLCKKNVNCTEDYGTVPLRKQRKSKWYN